MRYSGHVVGQVAEMHRSAGRMKLEGIICKLAEAPYRPGRRRDWLEVKCLGREELIVLGWTAPSRSRVGLGALQLGYHDAEDRLHYAGAVGTGFTDRELSALRERLDAMAAAAPAHLLAGEGEPIDPATPGSGRELVAEVKYTGWSGAGRVRHGVYLGLHQDKVAGEVVREVADPAAPCAAFQAKPARGTERRVLDPARPLRPTPPEHASTAINLVAQLDGAGEVPPNTACIKHWSTLRTIGPFGCIGFVCVSFRLHTRRLKLRGTGRDE